MHIKHNAGRALLAALWCGMAAGLSAQIIEEEFTPFPTGHVKECVGVGKITFEGIDYTDSLMKYIAKLDTVGDEKHLHVINAIYGTDTLECAVAKPEYPTRTMIAGVRYDAMSIESHLAPHKAYTVVTQDLPQDRLAMRVDSARNRPADNPVVLNAPQTCISYAFECLFRFHGIDPEPICYRRTVYRNMTQVDPFLARFCLQQGEYRVKKKILRKAEFPDKSVLVFRDKKGEVIHAVYCMNGLVYSKNGIGNYLVYSHVMGLLGGFSYRETHTITVHTLNTNIFKS